ncbi:hypothetical protein DQT32_03440 [Salmonella enterica subsp. enterica serovar Braenderup]|nr:hypothetical protein [Salmonella enterica subsp. enterica serovar Braenderup]
MGSFNTTCAISHAPIREGDKVRLFFLASESYRHNTEDAEQFSISKGCQCYPHDDFKVIGGVALEATYADYNNYEFDEDSIPAQFILDAIRENYSENIPVDGVDYNEYHDHMSVSVNELDWQKVLDMVHSGRLFLNGYTKRKAFVATMAVHESVFDVLMYKSVSNYDYDKQDYVAKTLDEYVSELINTFLEKKSGKVPQEYIDRAQKIYEKHFEAAAGNAEEISKLQLKMMDFAAEMAEIWSDRDDGNSRGGARDFVWHGGNPFNQMTQFGKKILLEDSDEDNPEYYQVTDEDVAYIAKLTAETEYFNVGMVVNNFMYRPIMTSGQEHDFPAHAAMLRKLADAIDDIPSPWSEEHLSVNIHRQQWQEITMTDIERQYNEWYDDDAEENLAVLKAAIKGLPVLVVKPEDMHYRNDKYELCDAIDNKTLELRIYNK